MKSKVLLKREDIVSYNTDTVPNKDSFIGDSRVNVPFPCDCINDEFLGHTFLYQHQQKDTYASISEFTFSNLTTKERMERDNVYAENSIPKFVNVNVNVTVNCSCGNRKVSKDYGLFITYPLRKEDTLESNANDTEIEADLLQRYNPGVNFSQGSGLVFIPGKDENGVYVPLPSSPRKADSNGDTESKFIVVDKSPEFSYEELANATNNFSLANKIGQGGFGEVYYGELKGKVRLIGYCIEGSLFLVYEYMDNGSLSQHLHNSAKEPLTWSTRLRIALDVARGLEYIHDHSVPVYIHRDIKSDNILLNGNFNGKIADFGMTKLSDVASSTDNTDHVVGTFGYMPPENAYGHISRKIDVYAFGVVMYELISAKAAVVKIDKPSTEFELKSLEMKTNESIDEYKSLVALFDEVIDQDGDPIEEGLRKLVDPRLGDNYSIDSIKKMTQLAKACINRDPKQRPTMRSVVVSLMTLNSTIDNGNRIDSAALSLAMEHH
ncbi:receptor-like protein kinase [Trifolium pratense]|uniref:Receptor-like protein kinase n=1 Tax=Trifolium pratense TaxID=57577 RepID=A0A2K3NN60_TRIPR|nr:receptor-like protein kinase [Trifolium pratense]